MNGMMIFSGNSNPELTKKICESLGKPLGKCKATKFSDGEIQLKIEDNVRGKDVFVVQSTCFPANDIPGPSPFQAPSVFQITLLTGQPLGCVAISAASPIAC